jgi:hypothetical protein
VLLEFLLKFFSLLFVFRFFKSILDLLVCHVVSYSPTGILSGTRSDIWKITFWSSYWTNYDNF